MIKIHRFRHFYPIGHQSIECLINLSHCRKYENGTAAGESSQQIISTKVNTYQQGRHKAAVDRARLVYTGHKAMRMTTTQKIKIKTKPVDKDNWKDFESLFESKGAPKYCWCMAWRMTNDELKHNNSPDRKKFIKQRVWSRTPIGLLGYVDKQPIAWCSIAPRETYQRLGGDDSLEKVWSVVCFFIKREYRDQGLVDRLIADAKKYAKKKGAKYLEAYPVNPDSPSYRFMGFRQTFEKAEFEFVKKAGTRRNVMTCKL